MLLARQVARVVVATLLLTASNCADASAQSTNDLDALNKRVVQLFGQGKYAEATAVAQHQLALAERLRGREHPNTLTSVNNLAELYRAQGRYAEAEPLLRRALDAQERVLGREHPNTLLSVNNLAELYRTQGRYAEAEPLYRRAIKAFERVQGREHPNTLLSVNNLALLHSTQGRFAEAEPLLRRALEAQERVLGREHLNTLTSVNNLAELYRTQGRYAEAEPLYRRVIEAFERMLGREHPNTLTSVNSLAELYRVQARYAEAEPLYHRSLVGLERVLGPEHPNTLLSANNLALLYQAQGRYAEAATLYRRTFEAFERVLGREHPNTAGSANNLAELYRAQGRYAEAEPLYRRAFEAFERVLGREHPNTLTSANNLASLHFAQRNWPRAAEFWRRSTAAIAARTQRSASDTRVTGQKKSESEQSSWQFWSLVKAVYRLAREGGRPDTAAALDMFQTAQWALSSEAAYSLAQMAARGAKGGGALAVLVRERQDLASEWQKHDAWRNAALGKETAKRDTKAEAENSIRLTAIDKRIAEIDKRLAIEFPDYASLANPAPVPAEDVQTQLGADEALVLFLNTPDVKPTPEETFIWVVTKTDIRWVRSDIGTAALTRETQALRCGLDAYAWDDLQCAQLTSQTYTEADRKAGKPLPFDHVRSHKLYMALFGQVEDIIKGKHLLIVPSGPLTQLPFQVLVSGPPPANGDHQAAPWLIRDHALTILPAVSSLKALRRVAHPSAATKPMIGFGNPLLDGQQGHPNPRYAELYKKHAQLARENQQCRTTALQPVADLFGGHRGIPQLETRSGLANVEHIRMQTPLPETADELCAVARDLKADAADIHLGKGASEHNVKALSASGRLARYRIVHFATHGALAGQLKGASEPGLLLTPPGAATEDDDGYLSASEIARLKLDADWVILSACNTAAGDATGAQALSGLARAFIYAQTRALLVSHWAVNSDATVKLITGAMREMASNAKVGRAEALRRSMLALIDKGEAKEAHPAYWAPFIVVGEGAR